MATSGDFSMATDMVNTGCAIAVLALGRGVKERTLGRWVTMHIEARWVCWSLR